MLRLSANPSRRRRPESETNASLTIANRSHAMKKLLALVLLGGVLATPALAQSVPYNRYDVRPSHQTRSQRVHPYDAERYQGQPSNNDLNGDFQLRGGER
jgi:hypothetical protein